MSSWTYFLLLIFISLIVQGFYSMLEMACVSFNRVRLQYYVSLQNRRAKWLYFLLNHPAYLFGTTLIGVNSAMQFGSECARRFYSSLGMNPDWAPIMQIILVVIFAELSPMFAARRYAESVAMLGMPILYISSLIMHPIIYILDLICRCVNYIFRVKTPVGLCLTREELQKALEKRDDTIEQSFDPILANIFSLKTKIAKDVMDTLNHVQCIAQNATVGDLKKLWKIEGLPFVPVYYCTQKTIVSIAYPRDLLTLSDNTPLRSYCRPPWFITEKRSILETIKEFRLNNQSVAIVLNAQGNAIGFLTLEAIVDEIFRKPHDWAPFEGYSPGKRKVFVDRSFPGNTLVVDINKWFHINLIAKKDQTLEEFMEHHLKRHLDKGDTIRVAGFELSVEESSLIAGKTILIRSTS